MAIKPKKTSRLVGLVPKESETLGALDQPPKDISAKVQLNVRCTPQQRIEIKHYASILGIGMNDYLMMAHRVFMEREGEKYPAPPRIS